MRRHKLMTLLFLLVAFSGLGITHSLQAAETPAQRNARMKWWREARFGMFVHWGLYAIPAGEWDGKTWNKGGMEWIQRYANIPADVYEKRLTPLFQPKRGFAKEWAQLAKQAGCKYVVFTNKHHDGFALHDSAVSTFDAKDVTGRDLHKEIVDAIRAEGLRVGVYHSLWDWHHPHAYAGPGSNNPPCQTMKGRDPNIYLDYLHKQVEEVVSHYGPVDIMWFDYSSPQIQGESWRASELLAMVRRYNPNVIVNNRLYRSVEAGWPKDWSKGFTIDSKYGDFSTPEQHIPPTGVPGADWETCMTMNGTWGYGKHHHDWKSSETLIRQLVDTASKGGNYLLNVGPMADGTVPPEAVKCMHDIGRWMDTNRESIYATTASPFSKLEWGRCTKRINGREITLYLHVFDWPEDRRLVVPGLNNAIDTVYLLANHKPLTASTHQGDVVVHLPEKPVDTVDTVVVVKLSGKLNVAAPKPAPVKRDTGKE